MKFSPHPSQSLQTSPSALAHPSIKGVCHQLQATLVPTVILPSLNKNLENQLLLDRYVWLRFVIRRNARYSV